MKINTYLTFDPTDMTVKPLTGTVSDWMSADQVKTWQPGDIKMVVSHTGSGKSYFVQHTLCDLYESQGKRILYLMPRNKIKEKFQKKLEADRSISLMTYQAVEEIQNDPRRSMGEWDVIICDECHFFLSDSNFNRRTDISFDWIMGQQNAVRVLLTATDNGISRFLQEQEIDFEKWVIPIKEEGEITRLSFFFNDENLVTIASQVVEAGGKGIFFLQSAKAAYTLHQQFEDTSLFLCSQHNKDFARFMDRTAILSMIEREQFDCPLLFATMALDSGITIKDRDLKSIVVDVADPNTIIQCVGRKRFVDNADSFDLYIRGRTNRQINGILQECRENAAKAKEYLESGAVEYNARHNRGNDPVGLVVDVPTGEETAPLFKKKLNSLRFFHILYQIEMYENILQRKDGYCGYVADCLNIEDYTIMEDNQQQQTLAEYLDRFVGKPMLTRKDKAPFIETLNIRRDRKLCKSFSGIAGWIEGSGLPYRLLEYQTSRSIDGKKKNYRAWEVVRLTV